MAGFRQTVRDLLRSLGVGTPHSDLVPWRPRTAEAEARAIQFLTRNLSPAQREQYERYRHFDVIGGKTGKHYRIWYGSEMNVEQLDQTGRGRGQLLCFVPDGGLPVGDIMLAQKIALELFEDKVILVANRSPPWNLDFERQARRHRR